MIELVKRVILLVLYLLGTRLVPEPVKLSLEDAVKNVLENNLTVKNAKYEIAKSDSLTIKNTSQFVWKAYGDITVFKNVQPLNNTTILAGTKISQDKIAAGLEKQFRTGTFLNLEASSTRFDSSAFEGDIALLFPTFSRLAIKPIYTGAFTIKLTQEVWKYSFGKVEKNTEKILKTKAVIERDQLVFLLSNLVTKTLVDYWALSIQESAVSTFEKLLKNAKFVRDTTLRKTNLGLSEPFEVNLWNSVVKNLESQLEKSKTEREIAGRNLKRILSVDPSVEVSGLTDLNESLPTNLDFQKDFQYALDHRIDLKNLRRNLEVAKLSLDNSEEEDKPSIKVSAIYSSRAQTLYSPQENFLLNNMYGIATFKYPETRGELSLSYPLWDEGIKATIKESRVNIEQIKEKEAALVKEIEEEVKNRLDAIKVSHTNLVLAKSNLEEVQKYYKGITEKFSQGRYTAQNLKTALDTLAQAELTVVQNRVTFNINLIRYELVKNSLFENYGIDSQAIVEEIVKASNESILGK